MRPIDADKLYESLMTIETGKKYNFCYPCKEILQVIKKQPTVTLPEPEWISTKEMQPPKPNGAKYYSLDGEDIAADEYNVMIKGATKPTSLYWSGDVWFSPYGIDAEYTYNVTHWKPLPEAYREEGDS